MNKTNRDFATSKPVSASSLQKKAGSKKTIWNYFWGTIIILLIIYVFAIINISHNKVVLSETGSLIFSKALINSFANRLPKILGKVDDDLKKVLNSEIEPIVDKEINFLFQPVKDQIPKFSDFHYSLTGEYTELTAALTDKMSPKIKNILFDGVDFDNKLDKALLSIDNQFIEKIIAVLNKANYKIQNNFQLSSDDINLITRTVQITKEDLVRRLSNPSYNTGKVVGLAAGSKFGGAMVAKIVSKKIAVKVITKAALKAGGVGAGALLGAGFGSTVPGIGSVIGGITGAAAAWVATDQIVIEIDQYLNQDEFEEQLNQRLEEQKENIKTTLKNAYSTTMNNLSEDYQDRWRNQVLRPIDLIRNGS